MPLSSPGLAVTGFAVAGLSTATLSGAILGRADPEGGLSIAPRSVTCDQILRD